MSGTIYELMPKVAEEIGAIGKDSQNKAQGFSFRSIDAVMGAAQPALLKHGVFYVPQVLDTAIEERTTDKGTVLRFVLLTVKFTFFGPSGDSVEAIAVGEAMDSGDKAANKAMSAALKYALTQTFCIPYSADGDADSESPAPVQPRTQAPRRVGNGAATDKQVNKIKAELRRLGGEMPAPALEAGFINPGDADTKPKASQLIDLLLAEATPQPAERRSSMREEPEYIPGPDEEPF